MAAPTAELAALALKTVPAAPVLAKGTKGTKRNVLTNSFKVTLKPNQPFYLFDFRVAAIFVNKKGEEKEKEVTKQTKDDFLEQDRKRASLIACLNMKRSGALKGEYLYDRAALLIGLQEVAACKGGEFVHTLTSKTAPDLFAIDSIKEAKEVRVTIKKAADTYQVTTNDMGNKDPAVVKAILSVINLATSQHIFEKFDDYVVYGNGNVYLMEPGKYGFASFDVGSRDKYGGVGMTKGARIIEGASGRSAALTVDTKKTAFHVDWQKVSEKMQQLGWSNNPAEATSCLAGLPCVVFYSGLAKKDQKARTIYIGKVSTKRVKDVTFKDEKTGKTMTLPQYVQMKYNTKIVDTNALVIIDKHDGNTYAPECLLLCPNQRVKSQNAQPVNTEKLIRESATLPERRLAETKTLAAALEIGTASKEQAKLGITVNTTEPIKVEARVLAPVVLGTGNGNTSASGPWAQGKYAQAPLPHFKQWTVLHLTQREGDLTGAVVDAIHRATRNGGWQMDRQMAVRTMCVPIEQDQAAQLERIFKAEKAAGSQFIVIITSHLVKNHFLIKLLELKVGIITQQITTKVAEKISHQANTASNVAIKTLEKLGGQNHFVSKTTADLPPWVTAKGTMICSIQMETPQSLTGKEKEQNALPSRPVMIGWSCDCVRGATERGTTDAQNEKEATHYISSWTYGMPKDYQGGAPYAAAYKEVALSILRAYKKFREAIPTRIVFIRGGVAEGDSEKIRSEELPLWQEVFKSLNAAYNPSFVIITASEMHADRFYAEKITGAKAPQQNLPSGTVIDTVVTNPSKSQAYIQSHVPLQGTAKVTRYTVEHMSLNPAQKMTVNMDDVIRLIHTLCFTHGVCNTPTAVPTPLYIARESMKRARDLFNEWNTKTGRGAAWELDHIIKEFALTTEKDLFGIRVNA